MDKALTMALQKAAMNGLKAVGALLETPTLILFQAITAVPSNRILITDITECDFDGYAAHAALVFGSAYQDDRDRVMISAPSVPFVATGSATPNPVVGYAITNAAKTALYYVEKFAEPVAINEAGDGLMVQPTIPYGF